jgi:hypothetical protein
MLLALDGTLHEARLYRNRNLNKRLEYAFTTFVHVVVATGVAMVGTGAGGRAWEQPKGERSDESRRWNGVARGMLGNINHTRSVDIEGLQREGHSRGDGRQNAPPRCAPSDGVCRYPGYVRTDRGVNPETKPESGDWVPSHSYCPWSSTGTHYNCDLDVRWLSYTTYRWV